MKYIFLDVDGVLNTSASWVRKMYDINLSSVEVLAQICKKTKAEIVLTSSWKTGFYKRAAASEWTPQIQALAKQFAKHNISIHDRTPDWKNKRRDEEITAFLDKNPASHYVILDDDMTLFAPDTKNLYHVNCTYGLTKYDIKPIVKILSK